MTKRVAIYTRAPEDQGTFDGLAQQERDCRAWAEEKGFEVTEVFKTVSTASPPRSWWRRLVARILRRPSGDVPFEMLLGAVQSGKYEAVVASSVDRYSRDTRKLQALLRAAQRTGTELFTVDMESELTELIYVFGDRASS